MNIFLAALNPVAFQLGSINVMWYGVIMAVAIFVGLWLAGREAVYLGLDNDYVIDLAIWMVPLGYLGARLYYVLFNLNYYLQNPGDILAVWEGGLAIYGGLIAGGLTLIWFSNRRQVPVWLTLDLIAPSVLLAQAIGRWGNFMNQEAHGSEVTRSFLEKLMLPNFIIEQMRIEDIYYHPTFLYESLWNLAGVIILLILRRRQGLLKRGEVALLYVAWYSFGRFFIEGLRTDSLYLWGSSIRVSQALSLLLFIIAVAVMIYRRRNVFPLPDYIEGIASEKCRRDHS